MSELDSILFEERNHHRDKGFTDKHGAFLCAPLCDLSGLCDKESLEHTN